MLAFEVLSPVKYIYQIPIIIFNGIILINLYLSRDLFKTIISYHQGK